MTDIEQLNTDKIVADIVEVELKEEILEPKEEEKSIHRNK